MLHDLIPVYNAPQKLSYTLTNEHYTAVNNVLLSDSKHCWRQDELQLAYSYITLFQYFHNRRQQQVQALPGTLNPRKNSCSFSISLYKMLRGSFARMASTRLVLFRCNRSHTLCLDCVGVCLFSFATETRLR